MQIVAEQTVRVECSAQKAYDYISDMTHFQDWFPEVKSIAEANALPRGTVGKEYLETVDIPMRGTQKVTITVKGIEAGKRFVTEGSLRPLLPRMEVDIRPAGATSCEISWRMLSRNESWFVRLLLLPLARGVMQKRAAIGVVRLQRILEQG